MSGKTVLRSVRLEAELDQGIEVLAAARGLSVSAFIRAALSREVERDVRRCRLERSLALAAELPEPGVDRGVEREAMWGIGTRVPR